MIDEKILDALIKANSNDLQFQKLQDRHLKEFDELRNKVDNLTATISALQEAQKNSEKVIDNERKLNRDAYLDLSKLMNEKTSTTYKLVSVIATVISIIISIVTLFVK